MPYGDSLPNASTAGAISGASTARTLVFRPQTDGIPAAVKALGLAWLERRLPKAKLALVRIDPKAAFGYAVQFVELGPIGLVGGDFNLKNQERNAVPAASAYHAWHILREMIGRGNWRRPFGHDRAAARAFLAGLDPAILAALRRVHEVTPKAYNWCLLNPGRHPSALLSWPCHARRMVKEDGDRSPSIDAALALGGSLEDAIVDGYDADRAVTRHLSRVPYAYVHKAKNDLENWLSRTPRSAWPRTEAQWRLWTFVWGLIDGPRFGQRDNINKDFVDRLAADTLAQPDWCRTAMANAEETEAAVASLRDPLHAFMNDVLVPAAAGTGAGRHEIGKLGSVHRSDTHAALWRIFAGRGGLPALLRLSAEWHRRINQTARMGRSERDNIADDARLATLFSAPLKTKDGLVFTPILTAKALRDEGKTMGHCIGDYVDRALLGKILAFHVTGNHPNAGKAVRATASLALKGDKWAYDDMRGMKDAVIKNDKTLVEPLVKLANAPDAVLTVDPKATKEWNETRGVDGMLAQPEIGVERAEAAWETWVRILPNRLKAKTALDALAGPFLEAGLLVCKKDWMRDVRVARANEKRRANLARHSGRAVPTAQGVQLTLPGNA